MPDGLVPEKKEKIGLTLSGGGAKGFAHIGVYQVLTQQKVPIDFITGTSVGAMVGAGIAMGRSPYEIMEIMSEFAEEENEQVLMGFNPFRMGKGSILMGRNEEKTLARMIPKELEFKDLKIPLAVNAVDVETGEQVVFKTGNVFSAVRASLSFPGLYPPLYHNDRLLIDGGVLNNLTVDICREMGADRVIAVDLKSLYSGQTISGLIYHFYVRKNLEKKYHLRTKKSRMQEFLLKMGFPINIMFRAMSIMQQKITDDLMRRYPSDLYIHPDVDAFALLGIRDYKEIYDRGVKAARLYIPDFKKMTKGEVSLKQEISQIIEEDPQ